MMNRSNINSGGVGRPEAPINVVLSAGGGTAGDTAAESAPRILAVSVSEAARMLGIGQRLCADLISSGELVSFKSGSRRLVAIAEIEAYIRRQQDADRTRAA